MQKLQKSLPWVLVLILSIISILLYTKPTPRPQEAGTESANTLALWTELDRIKETLAKQERTSSTNETVNTNFITATRTNVASSIVSSNISNTTINVAGGDITTQGVVTNLPNDMVFETLAPWPAWLGYNSTNTFNVPSERFSEGMVCSVNISAGKPVTLRVDKKYLLYPDRNDLARTGYLLGNDKGCLIYKEGEYKQIRPAPDGRVVHVFYKETSSSPVESDNELRFLVVKRK